MPTVSGTGAASARWISHRLVDPAAPYKNLNPYSTRALDSTLRKKYFVPDSSMGLPRPRYRIT